mmetsp:Transcript_75418/g.191367  ORF Transcript_75418/g.191367 Transcript_75418/m.191367 type:complete len:249 (-) Transcript_75418:517-1263(-)
MHVRRTPHRRRHQRRTRRAHKRAGPSRRRRGWQRHRTERPVRQEWRKQHRKLRQRKLQTQEPRACEPRTSCSPAAPSASPAPGPTSSRHGGAAAPGSSSRPSRRRRRAQPAPRRSDPRIDRPRKVAECLPASRHPFARQASSPPPTSPGRCAAPLPDLSVNLRRSPRSAPSEGDAARPRTGRDQLKELEALVMTEARPEGWHPTLPGLAGARPAPVHRRGESEPGHASRRRSARVGPCASAASATWLT